MDGAEPQLDAVMPLAWSGPAGLRLDPAPTSPSTARRWLHEVLAPHVCAPVLRDALLVATELVSNSLQHTDSDRIDLSVDLTPTRLVIQVHDQGPGLPTSRPAPGTAGRSRGLLIVSNATQGRLTCRPAAGGGSIVTAVIAIPAS